ncbi:MAG: HNH endonuclease [Frankiaceae bacterium]
MAVPGSSEKGPVQLTLDGSRVLPAPAAAELARFFAKVVIDPRPGGCHHWIGAIGDDGYGRFRSGAGRSARTVRPHLRVFELAHGLRPVQVPLLHSCNETGCVALEHLRVGTHAQNMAQMHRSGRGARGYTSVVDLRGPAGRARAIRAALADGWNQAAFTAASAAGNPYADQLALPVAPAVPAETYRAGLRPASSV